MPAGVRVCREDIHLKFKRSGILTKLILAAILIYAIASLAILRGKIEEANVEKAQLEQQVADKTAEKEKMQYAIENSDDDEVIKEVAKDKIGLVEQDEEIYYAG